MHRRGARNMNDLSAESEVTVTSSSKELDHGHAFQLEEFKLIVTATQHSIQMIVTWYTFFFPFQLTAFGWLISPISNAGMEPLIKNLTCGAFIGFNLLGLLLIPVTLRFMLQHTATRISVIRKNFSSDLQDPVHYRFYKGALLLMAGSMLIALSMWGFEIVRQPN